MKIVLLSTGRGLRPERIEELRARLGLLPSDRMCLVAWQRSGSPLPVDRHLVVGPHLLIGGGRGTDQKVQQPAPLDALREASALEKGTAVDEGSAVEEGAPANALVSEAAAARTREKLATAMLPVWHPRRVRSAVAWRVRRLKRRVSLRKRIRRNVQLRRIRNQLPSGASLGFAASCLWAGKVHNMTRAADIVIALDTPSHRGAWTLAKRVPGPDVVIGIPPAKRLLELRQLDSPVGPS